MKDIIESLKGFIVPLIVRWLFKVAGTALATVGISEASVTEIVSGVILFIVGAIISLVNHKKAIETEVK